MLSYVRRATCVWSTGKQNWAIALVTRKKKTADTNAMEPGTKRNVLCKLFLIQNHHLISLVCGSGDAGIEFAQMVATRNTVRENFKIFSFAAEFAMHYGQSNKCLVTKVYVKVELAISFSPKLDQKTKTQNPDTRKTTILHLGDGICIVVACSCVHCVYYSGIIPLSVHCSHHTMCRREWTATSVHDMNRKI